MRLQRRYLGIAFAMLVSAASVQAQPADGGAERMAPLPPALGRITPEGGSPDDAILTTHKTPAPLPWKAAAPAAQPMPVPLTNPPVSMKVPFGRAEAPPREIPSGPHTTTAVPVEDVDTIEATEPAPPTPVAPEADPATEDPSRPTELSSPIFDAAADSGAPRKMVLRALNKVTAQSARFEVKPGEIMSFGRLEITAVTCRTSLPTSQRDDAGLIDIVEHLPGTRTIKPIFHGWMYASSPSISALEHPIYDVTMVACEIAVPVAKAADKAGKKGKK